MLTKRSFLLLLLLSVPFMFYSETAEQVLGEKVTFDRVIKDSKGRLLGGALSQNTALTFKTYKLTLKKATDLSLYSSGNIRKCTLAGKLQITTYAGNLTAGENSLLAFDEEGILALGKCRLFLSGETDISIGGFTFKVTEKSRLFFASNKLIDFARSDLILARPYSRVINGIAIKLAPNKIISFFETGALRSGTGAENTTVKTPFGKVIIQKGHRLFFTPEAGLDYERTRFVLADNTPLQINGRPYTFKKESTLQFHKNGTPNKGYLTASPGIRIAGAALDLKEGSEVVFNHLAGLNLEESRLELSAEHKRSQNGMDLTFAPDNRIEFFNNGLVKSGVLQNKARLFVYSNSIPVKAKSKVYFYDNGAVDLLKTALELAEDKSFAVSDQQVVIKGGTRLFFHLDGKLDYLKTTITVGSMGPVVVGSVSYPAKKDSDLQFYPGGTVKMLTTGEKTAASSGKHAFDLPPGSKVFFNEEKGMDSIVPGADTKITAGGNTFLFKKGVTINFYPDGTIRDGVLSEGNVVTMGQMQLPLKKDLELKFYEDGTPIIVTVTLHKDAVIPISSYRLNIQAGSIIQITESRKLDILKSRFRLAEDSRITVGGNTFVCRTGDYLFFYPGGSVLSLPVKEDPLTVVGSYSLPLKGDRRFYFKESGAVDTENTEIKLGKEHILNIKGISFPLAADTWLYFLTDNSLDYKKITFRTSKNSDIKIGRNTIPVKEGTRLYFDGFGNLDVANTSCILYKNLKLTLDSLSFTFIKDNGLRFFPDLQIASGFVNDKRELVLNGGTINVEGNRTYHFAESGAIDYEKTELILTRDVSIKAGLNSLSLKKGTRVIFHPNQMLESCRIDSDAELIFNGVKITVKKERNLYFDEHGRIDTRLTRLVLAKNAVFTIGKNTLAFLADTRIYFYESGSIRQGILAKNTKLQLFNYTIELRKGKRVYFYESGAVDSELTEIYLEKEEEFTVGTHRLAFAKRSRIYFDDQGKITRGTLTAPKELKIGTNSLLVSEKHEILFYPEGTVKQAYLAENRPLTAGASTFTAGKNTEVRFYPGGTISRAELGKASPITTGGGKPLFKQYTVLHFYPQGTLKEGILQNPTVLTIGGAAISFDNRFPVTFYPNGNLEKGLTTERKQLTLRGLTFTVKENTYISFYKSGALKNLFIAEPLTARMGGRSVRLQGGTTVSLYENGSIKEGYVKTPLTVTLGGSTAVFDNRAAITFYSGGNIQEGVLLEKTAFNQAGTRITFAEGTRITFYTNGLVRTGFPAVETRIVYAGYQMLFCPGKELSFTGRGSLIYGCIAKETVLKTANGEKLHLARGDWLYIREAGGDFKKYYGIDQYGKLLFNTPIEVGSELIMLPKGSKVAFKGDDTIFKVLIPSSTIYFKKQTAAKRLLEIYYSDLEKRISEINAMN